MIADHLQFSPPITTAKNLSCDHTIGGEKRGHVHSRRVRNSQTKTQRSDYYVEMPG